MTGIQNGLLANYNLIDAGGINPIYIFPFCRFCNFGGHQNTALAIIKCVTTTVSLTFCSVQLIKALIAFKTEYCNALCIK